MATLIKQNGEVTKVQPKNGTDFGLKELYELLECDIVEVVYGLPDNKIMIVDEEGRYKQTNHLNIIATRLFHMNNVGINIVGHALVCDSNELK